MDRRTLTAVFLSVLVYYTWLNYMETKTQLARAESGEFTTEDPAGTDPGGASKTKDADGTKAKTKAAVPEPVRSGRGEAFPAREVSFQACGATTQLHTEGGYFRHVVLDDWEAAYDVQPLHSWILGRITGDVEGPWKPYGDPPGREIVLGTDGQALGFGSGDYDTAPPRYEVLEESRGRLVLRGWTADEIEVRTTFSEGEGTPCLVDVDITWTNQGDAEFTGGVWVGMHEPLPEGGAGGMFAAYQNQKTPMAVVDGDYEAYTSYHKLEKLEEYPGPVTWFGLADRYFGFILLPNEGVEGTLAFSRLGTEGESTYGAHLRFDGPLAVGASHEASYRLFVGDLAMDELALIHPDLTSAVELGWFAFFAKVLIWLLGMFHAAVGNWGLSIVMLTVMVKIIFFPLTQTAFKSSQAMASLQPKMQDLREEYKDNQEELNRRMVELFRDNGVNPFGGCLPMVIQMPVWIALYRVLLSSVDLYHTEFLYLRDLSSVDPYLFLPATVVGLMLVQQQFMPTGNMDPAQARMMKVMPLFFGIFFFVFPSGLVVYIFVNMLLSIAQQWFIKRTFKVAETQQPAAAT